MPVPTVPSGLPRFRRTSRLAAERGQQVVGRALPPIHLARLQGGGGGRRVGHDAPLDAVEVDVLRARRPARLAGLARAVGGVALPHRAGADHALAGQEAEGAGAYHLLDLLRGVGRGQALGHDKERRGADLRQALQHRAEGALEADGEGAVVGRRHLGDARHQHLAEPVARRPAADGGDAVAPAHRLAVVEEEAVAEAEGPALAVVLDGVSFHHLRLRAEFAVEAVELVPDHEGVVAGDIGGGDHGVDHRQVGLRHVAERPRAGGLGEGGTGEGQGGGAGASSADRVAAWLPLPRERGARTGVGAWFGAHAEQRSVRRRLPQGQPPGRASRRAAASPRRPPPCSRSRCPACRGCGPG